MFKNYLKIAFRNFTRHKTHTIINLSGLAVGMACCMAIMLYVKDELSFDRFNEKSDRIYRVLAEFNDRGETNLVEVTSPPIGPGLKTDIPEIENFVRMGPRRHVLVHKGEQSFYEDELFYTDPSIFEIFSFPLLSGNVQTALNDLSSVVINRDLAEKYFGSSNPIGQSLEIEINGKMKTFTVSGILKDIPVISHIQPALMISFENEKVQRRENWQGFGFYTYVLLREDAYKEIVDQKMAEFMRQRMPNPRLPGMSKPSIQLQALTDIHLHSDFSNSDGSFGNLAYVYLFSALAIFIILIACINFMNLSTARSLGRAKEVGVRKSAGAFRFQLIRQFLSESLLLATLALIIALGIVELILPLFNSLAGRAMEVHLLSDWSWMSGLVILTLLVGFFAGSYPAFVLSRFNPIDVLKDRQVMGTGGAKLRQGLVVVQFLISATLIVGTVVVFSQLNYIRNKNLGFDREHVIVLNLRNSTVLTQLQAFKSAITVQQDVLDAAFCNSLPGQSGWWVSVGRPDGAEPGHEKRFYAYYVDEDYFKTLSSSMASGRAFSKDFPTDKNKLVINESAAIEFGWGNADGAVGKQFISMAEGPENSKPQEIIGVVHDFHYRSLREKIDPAVFILGSEGFFESIAVRIRPNSTASALEFLQKTWKAFDPNRPFEYRFLEDGLRKQYEAEEKLSQIFGVFAGLAIFIACLGLYGLAAFTSEKRTKEIGIRKVLGATVSGIVRMLSAELVKLVLISNLIAWPVAYFSMKWWLESFAYRVELNWMMFAGAGVMTLAIAFLTISYHAIKAATSNPVNALKYE